MSAPSPCSRCGAPGVKHLGTQYYCTEHLTEFYRKIKPETWAWRGAGIGLPESIDEHGECLLRCPCCGATWYGPAFTDCPWCVEDAERQREHQRGLLLRCPIGNDYPAEDLGLSDLDYRVWCRTRGLPFENRDKVMSDWQQRLRRGVESQLITRREAEAAWSRAQRRAST